MADNTTNLEKAVVIGGSEHLRDSDYEEALVEGLVYVGDALVKGTAETQVAALASGAVQSVLFKGIAIQEQIRSSDLATYATVLTAGKTVKYLKPTGGRVKVRAMAMGYTTGAVIPTGSPVLLNAFGSTIGSSGDATQIGDFYIDPACTDDQIIIGRTSKPVTAPDATTNSVNVEIEFWY